MRIDELALIAFGPFTDKRLDFSAGQEGLHLVYGPNEAGKSSALRALRDAFYGIPSRSTDNFVHRHQDLRVGMTLRTAGGEQLRVVRRKGTSKTLLDARTESPINEAKLERLLSGVTRDMYESMFGINYSSLVEGGKDIASLEGKVGESLFSAAGGVSRLRQLQQQLEEQADELFKAGGSKPKLNLAIGEYKNTLAEIKAQRIASKDYDSARQELEDARRALQKSLDQLRALRARREHLDNLRKGRARLARRRDTLHQLAKLIDTVRLRPGFDVETRQTRQRLDLVEDRRRNARQQLEECKLRINSLEISPAAVALREELQPLTEERGSHIKARADLQRLQRARDTELAQAEALLQRTRPGSRLADIESLRLPRAERNRIKELMTQYSKRQGELTQTTLDLRESRERLAQAEGELRELGPRVDLRDLHATVQSIQELGPLEQNRQTLLQEMARESNQLETQLRQLGRWSTSLEILDKTPIPSRATIDLHERQLDELARDIKDVKKEIAKLQGERRKLAADLTDLLESAGDLPDDASLDEARRAREQLWRLVRNAWESGQLDSDRVAEVAARLPPTLSSPSVPLAPSVPAVADRYEQAVERADSVVDHMRTEQERIADRKRLETEIQRRDSDLTDLQARLSTLEADGAERRAEWSRLWKPLHIEAGTPAEMRDWRSEVDQLRSRIPRLRELESQTLELARQITESLERLNTQLMLAEQPALPSDMSLKAALQRCQTLLQEQIDRSDRRAHLQTKIAEHRRNVDKYEQQEARLQAAEADWREAWRGAIRPLGLAAELPPSEVEAFLDDLDSLLRHSEQLHGPNGLMARIQGMQDDANRFAQRVQHAAEGLGWSLPDDFATNLPETAQRVIDALQQAQQSQQALNNAQVQLKDIQNKIDQLEQEEREARLQLRSLCLEAQAASPEELDERWRKSVERDSLEQTLSGLERELYDLAGGRSLDEWEQEAFSVDDDQRRSQVELLDEQLHELETHREQESQLVGRCQAELDRMNAGTQVIELSAKTQGQLARIETLAVQYARIRLASHVLRKAIDRFGEQNQGPMLNRASDYFARLTGGSFSGLKVDYDEKDEPILVGRRSGVESSLDVTGMSEGTADQLYFALRLAYLADWLERHEPLPLVVDDVLIKFDDERALATLGCLAEFSRKTQVILFTHHEHLLDLAAHQLPPDTVFVHRLDRDTSPAR